MSEIITVQLQEPFHYALWIIVLLGLFVFGYLFYLIFGKYLKKRMEEKRAQDALNASRPRKVVLNLPQIKSKYLNQLYRVDQEVTNGKITTRVAYQRMSKIIRHFVHEVTGIKVQNYTLQDVSNMEIPYLEDLMVEYYRPEFSRESVGDAKASIAKTRRAIETWN